eukprot:EG_transcript_5006
MPGFLLSSMLHSFRRIDAATFQDIGLQKDRLGPGEETPVAPESASSPPQPAAVLSLPPPAPLLTPIASSPTHVGNVASPTHGACAAHLAAAAFSSPRTRRPPPIETNPAGLEYSFSLDALPPQARLRLPTPEDSSQNSSRTSLTANRSPMVLTPASSSVKTRLYGALQTSDRYSGSLETSVGSSSPSTPLLTPPCPPPPLHSRRSRSPLKTPGAAHWSEDRPPLCRTPSGRAPSREREDDAGRLPEPLSPPLLRRRGTHGHGPGAGPSPPRGLQEYQFPCAAMEESSDSEGETECGFVGHLSVDDLPLHLFQMPRHSKGVQGAARDTRGRSNEALLDPPEGPDTLIRRMPHHCMRRQLTFVIRR